MSAASSDCGSPREVAEMTSDVPPFKTLKSGVSVQLSPRPESNGSDRSVLACSSCGSPARTPQLELPATKLGGGSGQGDLPETGQSGSTSGPTTFQDDWRQHSRIHEQINDRRQERDRLGMVKWELERGVPDVGGIGWRSKTGHPLKNQTFYGSKPGENTWNDPTHAGPKTWKEFHGPRLRSDAQLMERLDRLDSEQEEWDAKKNFVNTVRVQNLDRFYHHKTENEERAVAQTWAPHRRARSEVHSSFEGLGTDIDSMPAKELKKVLTSHVLHADREGIRNITKRVQAEETWKAVWKQAQVERRDAIRADLEHRRTYNEMLMEFSGQPPTSRFRDPNRKVPNTCTTRIEELALHKDPPGPGDVGVTRLTDFRGLVHVDNQHAMEARFPGTGHDLSVVFCDRANESARVNYEGQPRPETPELDDRIKTAMCKESVRRASVPVSKHRLTVALQREDPHVLAMHATDQFAATKAPPAPEQRKTLMNMPVNIDPVHMSGDFAHRTEQTIRRASSIRSIRSLAKSTLNEEKISMESLAPPRRSMFYPVLVASSISKSKDSQPKPPSSPSRRKPEPVPPSGRPPHSARGRAAPRPSVKRTPLSARASQLVCARRDPEPTMAAVCDELNAFDAANIAVPHLGNYFLAPSIARGGGAQRDAIQQADGAAPDTVVTVVRGEGAVTPTFATMESAPEDCEIAAFAAANGPQAASEGLPS